MEILNSNQQLSNTTLILGFFDGIHSGHRILINSAVNYAKNNNCKTVLLTFKSSPAEYFNSKTSYIYTRKQNYNIIESLCVDYIHEAEFNNIVNIQAENYLKNIVKQYSPKAIFTGFNHTFGKNREGNPAFLERFCKNYNIEYKCIPPYMANNIIISSSYIKTLLSEGLIEKANTLLEKNFQIEGSVIHGKEIGRSIGFPTANILYPKNIVQIPYGVYKVKTLNKPAILNWGIKPTLNGTQPIMETHIINFNGNLYDKIINIEFIKKIRDEQKFNNLNELKTQIEKDVKLCLES